MALNLGHPVAKFVVRKKASFEGTNYCLKDSDGSYSILAHIQIWFVDCKR